MLFARRKRRLLRVTMFCIAVPCMSEPIESIALRSDGEAGTRAAVEASVADISLRLVHKLRTSPPGTPFQSWFIAHRLGMIGDLAPDGIYRRLLSPAGVSLFVAEPGALPLRRGALWDSGDGADLLFTLSSPKELSSAALFLEETGNYAPRLGAFGSFTAPEANATILLLASNTTGEYLHIVGALSLELAAVSLRGEARLSGGGRVPAGGSGAFGAQFDAGLFTGAIEFAGWGERYVLPGGVLPRLSMMSDAELALSGESLRITADHRLELERLAPKRADYRGSVETVHLSAVCETGRLDLTLAGELVQRVNPERAELPKGSVSIGGGLEFDPVSLRALCVISGDSSTRPSVGGTCEARASFESSRGRTVAAGLAVSVDAESRVSGSFRVSTSYLGARLSLSASVVDTEAGVDLDSFALSYSFRSPAADETPDAGLDAQ